MPAVGGMETDVPMAPDPAFWSIVEILVNDVSPSSRQDTAAELLSLESSIFRRIIRAPSEYKRHGCAESGTGDVDSRSRGRHTPILCPAGDFWVEITCETGGWNPESKLLP